jgi:ADP-heptose:LPS heptosyltransferase
MNIIFTINGGMGKCVMATAVCSAIKTKYPKANLIVVSGYPEVFVNNPNVSRAFQHGNLSYFYDNYIRNQKVLVFANDPYLTTEHINQKEHLIETWCNMFDIPFSGEKPEIFLNAREQKYFGSQYITEKPILLIQANGGSATPLKYSWARDLPFDLTQSIIDKFANEYHVITIGREDQAKYQNATPITADFRALCVLISMSSKRLLIDSFAQHVAAAFNLKSTVCWIANKPEVFGYDVHDNISSNQFTIKPETKNSFLTEFNIQGDLLEFPYKGEHEVFDEKAIIQSLKGE